MAWKHESDLMGNYRGLFLNIYTGLRSDQDALWVAVSLHPK